MLLKELLAILEGDDLTKLWNAVADGIYSSVIGGARVKSAKGTTDEFDVELDAMTMNMSNVKITITKKSGDSHIHMIIKRGTKTELDKEAGDKNGDFSDPQYLVDLISTMIDDEMFDRYH